MFVKYGQQDSGVYITGTQGALHSSTVTWLKGWDRLSLALQCIPQALIRDLTIQQQNYLTTREGTASEFIDTPKSIVLPYFMFSRTQIWSSYVVVAKEKKFLFHPINLQFFWHSCCCCCHPFVRSPIIQGWKQTNKKEKNLVSKMYKETTSESRMNKRMSGKGHF